MFVFMVFVFCSYFSYTYYFSVTILSVVFPSLVVIIIVLALNGL